MLSFIKYMLMVEGIEAAPDDHITKAFNDPDQRVRDAARKKHLKK